MKKVNKTELVIFIVSAELVGALSALFSGGYSKFHDELIQPPLSPPAVLFPIVWVILYALMGISAYLIYSAPDDYYVRKRTALGIYALQLAVNFMWSIIYFRFRLLTAAAVGAVILTALVAAMIVSFWRIRRLAAGLNVPYLLWCIFASYLSIAIAILN